MLGKWLSPVRVREFNRPGAVQVGRLLSKKLERGQAPRKSAHILTAKEEKVRQCNLCLLMLNDCLIAVWCSSLGLLRSGRELLNQYAS